MKEANARKVMNERKSEVKKMIEYIDRANDLLETEIGKQAEVADLEKTTAALSALDKGSSAYKKL